MMESGDISFGKESPFFGRPYGSYTPEQFKRISALFHGRSRTLLEPMCGTGWCLPHLLRDGHNITCIEVNPTAAAFAALRSPYLHERLDIVESTLDRVLSSCPPFELHSVIEYESGWLPTPVQVWLRHYGAEVREFVNSSQSIDSEVTKCLLFLPILSARRLGTFSSSDNVTWAKPGGMIAPVDIAEENRSAFRMWSDYIESIYGNCRNGTLTVISEDFFTVPIRKTFEGMFFSPPYANRLDYLRLWAVESAVYGEVVGQEPFKVSKNIIGSNVVRGKQIDKSLLRRLPTSVQRSLHAISTDGSHGSANYYFPFFAHYATNLYFSVLKAGSLLSRGGVGLIFVRDTPRKDVLFPTAALVASALKKSGCKVTQMASRVIRGHIGMRRRREHRSLQGLAQQEWSIEFERVR